MFILNTTPVIPPQSQIRVGPNSRRSTTAANDLDEDLADGDNAPFTFRGPDADTVTMMGSIDATLDAMGPNNPLYQFYVEARRRGLEYIANIHDSANGSQSGNGGASDGGDTTQGTAIPPELPPPPHSNEINDRRRIPPPPLNE